MKKSALKEFIISSVAATVAGFLVKKGYDYFREKEFPKVSAKEENSKGGSLRATSQNLVNTVSDTAESIKDNPAQQGLLATLAYTISVYAITKFLRKII